jgi:hypothetical protein
LEAGCKSVSVYFNENDKKLIEFGKNKVIEVMQALLSRRLATAQESAAKPGTALPLACRGRLRMLPMRAAQNNLPLHIRRRSRTRSQSCILATTNGFLIWSGDPLPGVLGRRDCWQRRASDFSLSLAAQLTDVLL